MMAKNKAPKNDPDRIRFEKYLRSIRKKGFTGEIEVNVANHRIVSITEKRTVFPSKKGV